MRRTTIALLLSNSVCLLVNNTKELVCIVAVLLGVTFSCQAQVCPTPPAGAPGPSTSTGSGTLYGPATYLFSGYAGSIYAGESARATLNPGGFTVSINGCGTVPWHNLGTLTVGSLSVSWTQTIVDGYATGAAISIAGMIASPKNNGSQDPTCSANTCEGNPMNVAVGNKYQVETDFVGTSSTHIELKRYYNSQAVLASPFGMGWRSTYDRAVISFGSNYAQVMRADGHMDSFTFAGGVWTSDPDVTSTLTPILVGATQIGWQVVTADDTTENYNLGGLLTSIVTRSGLTTTLTYNSNYQLITVTGPFGHTLTYTYNTNGNVSTVSIPDGGIYTYTYDTHNNLISVTYPDAKVRQYAYANTSYVNALTGITDELGHAYASWTYSSSPYFPSAAGIVTSSQHAGGADLTSVSYTFGSVTVTDPNSNTHTYSLMTQFGVVKPTTLTGVQVASVGGKAFSYDSNGFISSKTDYNNNITHYTHDTRGNETSRTEAYGTSLARTISTTWHATFHLPLTITELNRTTTFTYDANGNMLTKTVTAGTASRTWTYTYNSNGQVLTAADPNSNVTTYTYDSHGDIASITDAAGHQTQFTSYDADGKPLSITDPNGLVTTLAYDARGRLTSRTVGSEVTSYTYDAAGNLTKVTQPDSSYLVYSYDNAHRLTGVTDSLGNSIVYTLDAASNVTAKKIFDGGGTVRWTRSYTYDAVERLKTEVGASGQTTTYAYDGNGNLTSVTDPLSHAFSYSYDALNRRATTVDPNSQTTSYGYDANDHLTSVTDPRSLVTSYTFTGLNNLTAISSPDTGSTMKTYDPAGNVLTSTDANGNTTTYTYDSLNRVSTASYADGTSASWAYDQGTYGKGHLTTLTDVTGTTSWTYDIHGRVTQKQQTTGTVVLTTGYTYDSFGRLLTVTYPSGNSVTLAYNGAGRVNSISSGGSALVSSITYMPFGQLSGWTEGNGASYSRTIDQDGRLSAIAIGGTTSVPGTTTLSYTLDNANRITGLAETGLANKTFGYDSLDRLISFANGSATTSYSYDNDGNRTSVTTGAGMTTYSYPTGTGANNRLSGISGLGSASFGYDSDGHMRSDGVNTWAYDARGRMVSDTISSVTTSYGVNALGQRITKSGVSVPPAGLNEYIYDEKGHLLGDYDDAGNPLTETVWLGNVPVAVLTGSGPSAASHYVNPDNINAPHVITDNNGNPVWAWDHFAFGDNAPSQNPSGFGVFNYNPRFPGQYADGESGLNYNLARDYAPGLGRYIESDPIGLNGGINTYGYTKGNPLRHVDPRGLQTEDEEIDPRDFDREIEPPGVYGGLDYREESIDEVLQTSKSSAGGMCSTNVQSALEELGGGQPRLVPTPKGATQFIFPNGTILRFDLQPGQYLSGQGPHINLELPGEGNIHIPIKP